MSGISPFWILAWGRPLGCSAYNWPYIITGLNLYHSHCCVITSATVQVRKHAVTILEWDCRVWHAHNRKLDFFVALGLWLCYIHIILDFHHHQKNKQKLKEKDRHKPQTRQLGKKLTSVMMGFNEWKFTKSNTSGALKHICLIQIARRHIKATMCDASGCHTNNNSAWRAISKRVSPDLNQSCHQLTAFIWIYLEFRLEEKVLRSNVARETGVFIQT